MTEAAAEDLITVGAAPVPLAVGETDLDVIADVETKKPKNRARVGSLRPSAMLYT
jgi:hypothetical protein